MDGLLVEVGLHTRRGNLRALGLARCAGLESASARSQGWKNFLCATRRNGTTPKKSVAKLEPGLKTWSPKQNTKANSCKTVQKQK